MSVLVPAADTARSVMMPLPCGHHNARLPGRAQFIRRCGTCRHWWLIEFYYREMATCTDITCAECLGELDSMGDIWTCRSCGAEWDDTQVSGAAELHP